MPDKPIALSTIPPQPPAEGEYDVICTTVMGSAQGRWFLDEYARRNRNVDTQLVLAAIERIEAAIHDEHGPQGHQGFRADLLDMAKVIAQTRTDAIKPEAGAQGKSAAAPASSNILAAAERIQDVAWTMRERGLEPRICEQIEALASSILSASSLHNPDDHRTGKLTEVLQYLERRIDALLDACAGVAQSSIEQAPTAHASSAEEVRADAAGDPAPGGNGCRESGPELVVLADDGAPARATQSVPPPFLPPSTSDDAEPMVEAPAETVPVVYDKASEPRPTRPQEPQCEPAVAEAAASDPSFEMVWDGPSPEVASQRPGWTPLPPVEFPSQVIPSQVIPSQVSPSQVSPSQVSEPAATPEDASAATETIPEPRREPASPAVRATLEFELDPLVVVLAGPRETSADAQPLQLEHDPIVVEPLFGAAASAPPPQSAPVAPPRVATREEAAGTPEEEAPGPAFQPPEVAMVFLVEGAGPASEDEPANEDEPAEPAARQDESRSEAPTELAEDLLAPLPVTWGSQPAAAPAPPPAVAAPQPSPSDPLAALKAMSEEERIALFT